MIYRKPGGMSYSEMCIFVETEVYKDSYDENLVFEYLYHIIRMLAVKNKLFNDYGHYDGFSVFGATRVFKRLTNKKQFQYDENGEPLLKPVKSVLNYIEKTLRLMQNSYMKEEFSTCISKERYEEEVNYNFNNILSRELCNCSISDFGLTLGDIDKTCKKFLSTIPYPTNSAEWMNIYTSVMLTFISSITLSNKNKKRIEELSQTNSLKDAHYEAFYKEASYDVVLYHLPQHMHDYILVLCRQLNSIIAKDLQDVLHTKLHFDHLLIEGSKQAFIEEVFNDDNQE